MKIHPVPYGLRYSTFNSYVPVDAEGNKRMAEYERKQAESEERNRKAREEAK